MNTSLAIILIVIAIYLLIAFIVWLCKPKRNNDSGDFFESLFWMAMIFDDNDFDSFD
jgi:Trk-type K+ transport system membrane component